MIQNGVYPASVTPFDSKDRVDIAGVARLLAWFEAAGCKGVVLAGTNGEGPSLSAVEKRDLIRDAAGLKGKLDLILGIATPSLDEAKWLASQAGKAGAAAVLVMPPYYFRSASDEGIELWFREVLEASTTGVLIYNHPKMTGFPLSAAMVKRLSSHERMAGIKDSSGSADNISEYRSVLQQHHKLFVGDETLLLQVLGAGWSGTISGAANVLPVPICAVVQDYFEGKTESAEAKFALILPEIEKRRSLGQPSANKRELFELGVIPSPKPRLPLL